MAENAPKLKASSYQPGKRDRAAIVAASWHGDVVEPLIDGASEVFSACFAKDAIDVFRVPGCYELPQAIDRLSVTGRHRAFVALGCVLRGKTLHFEMIGETVHLGLDQVARSRGCVVTSGVILADDHEQALARSGGAVGHKGREAAEAALMLLSLYQGQEK